MTTMRDADRRPTPHAVEPQAPAAAVPAQPGPSTQAPSTGAGPAGAGSAGPAERGRDRYIDSLRALALVRVVTYHLFGWVWLPILFRARAEDQGYTPLAPHQPAPTPQSERKVPHGA